MREADPRTIVWSEPKQPAKEPKWPTILVFVVVLAALALGFWSLYSSV